VPEAECELDAFLYFLDCEFMQLAGSAFKALFIDGV